MGQPSRCCVCRILDGGCCVGSDPLLGIERSARRHHATHTTHTHSPARQHACVKTVQPRPMFETTQRIGSVAIGALAQRGADRCASGASLLSVLSLTCRDFSCFFAKEKRTTGAVRGDDLQGVPFSRAGPSHGCLGQVLQRAVGEVSEELRRRDWIVVGRERMSATRHRDLQVRRASERALGVQQRACGLPLLAVRCRAARGSVRGEAGSREMSRT